MSCYYCRTENVGSCRWCKDTICSKHCVYVYENEVPLMCCLTCVKTKDLHSQENYFLEELLH